MRRAKLSVVAGGRSSSRRGSTQGLVDGATSRPVATRESRPIRARAGAEGGQGFVKGRGRESVVSEPDSLLRLPCYLWPEPALADNATVSLPARGAGF